MYSAITTYKVKYVVASKHENYWKKYPNEKSLDSKEAKASELLGNLKKFYLLLVNEQKSLKG